MLDPGVAIGRYKVMEVLGSDAWGVVYKVRHTVSQSYHALRLVSGLSSSQADAVRAEIKVQRTVFHPNLLLVTDLVDVAGEQGLGLVQDYVDGTTLADVLAEGPMEVAEAMPLYEQILEGVGSANAAGLVHESLAPECVVLDVHPDGVTARIAEFGLWRAIGPGSPARRAFVAPEVRAAGAQRDARADVYALGGLLVELLVARDVPGRVDGLPPAIATVARRALAERVEDRYVDVDAMAAALFGGPESAAVEPEPAAVEPVVQRPENAVAPLVASGPPAVAPALVPAPDPPAVDPAWVGVRLAVQFVIAPVGLLGGLALLGAWLDAGALRASRAAAGLAELALRQEVGREADAAAQLAAWGAMSPEGQLRAAREATTLPGLIDADAKLLEALGQELRLAREPSEPDAVRRRREIERMIAVNREHLDGYRAAATAEAEADGRPFALVADALGLATPR